MQTGHSIRFGHKVWCDILVEPAVVEEPIVALVEAPVVQEPEIVQPMPKI